MHHETYQHHLVALRRRLQFVPPVAVNGGRGYFVSPVINKGTGMSFKDRVIAASKADPVWELVKQLHDEGMTEQELSDKLKDNCFASVSQAFKITLQNRFRDLVISRRRSPFPADCHVRDNGHPQPSRHFT